MRGAIVTLALLAVFTAPPLGGVRAALGQPYIEQNVHVIQQRPFLRRHRVEVAPYFALATNEVLFLQLGPGGAINFYPLDRLAIGGSYTKYFTQETGLYDSIQTDFRTFPEKWEIDFFAGGHVSYTFLDGKFLLLNSSIVHFDAYFIAGMGVTRTNLSDTALTGSFGLGFHLFLTDWLTLNFEVRDYIFQEKFKAGERIINNVMLQTGLSFFIPFRSQYRYPR